VVLQQFGIVCFQMFISLSGLIRLFQNTAKRKTRFSKWEGRTFIVTKYFHQTLFFLKHKGNVESFLDFPMCLAKYINYIKHNRSNCISWGKWKGKADGGVNIPKHNLSTEVISA